MVTATGNWNSCRAPGLIAPVSETLQVQIDSAALQREIDALAEISEQPAPVVTRVLFSEADLRARKFVKQLCGDAGLALREDAVGNLFARWPGKNPALPPVATGSHIDAIPNAGKFDGVVGVLGGLEAIRALKRAGFEPARAVELIVFTAEEPTRLGIGCLGSRLLSGVLAPEKAAGLRDSEGVTLEQWRRRAGCAEAALESVRLSRGCYSAFVELHIEQGPLLEREGIPIGIVEKIAAPATLRLELTGEGGHAGAVLMPERRDALLAGAEIALAVERAVTSTGSKDTVGTTGLFRIEPGAVNSVPSRALLEIDVRDTQQLCDAELVNTVASVCERLQLPARRMISRAYHDSLFMALLCPMMMIFIPCRGGVSHRPDEYSTPEQIHQGVRVLAGTLAALAAR